MCVNHILCFDVASFINFSINYFLFNYSKIVRKHSRYAHTHKHSFCMFVHRNIYCDNNQRFGHLNCTDPILGLNIKSKFYKRIFIRTRRSTHNFIYEIFLITLSHNVPTSTRSRTGRVHRV